MKTTIENCYTCSEFKKCKLAPPDSLQGIVVRNNIQGLFSYCSHYDNIPDDIVQNDVA